MPAPAPADRPVVVGLDGSRESRAAAEWAAREALALGVPLRLTHVWEPIPEPFMKNPPLGVETQRHWSERVPREAAEGLRLRHPGLDITVELLSGRPAEALTGAADGAALLVLGSRGLSGVGGFMVGSVGHAVVARARRPVVLVRAGQQAADEHEDDPAGISSAATPYRPVVLGLDTASPDPATIGFAFSAAARRGTALRVVHGWNPAPYTAYAVALDPAFHGSLAQEAAEGLAGLLSPWRERYPQVEVVAEALYGTPGDHLVDASHRASLVVVGRRVRRGPLGTRIGPVTHTVLHHSTAPVAVVPHD
ncbi:universal stress protein [Streptomyces sp. NPDC048290]|uniref:universal stress protein n=1 Tax=Streptomyces sp. NPDC048290 TaxID=3155811 RepID=UPI0034462CB5